MKTNETQKPPAGTPMGVRKDLDRRDKSLLKELGAKHRCQQRLCTDGGLHYIYCGAYNYGPATLTSHGYRCAEHVDPSETTTRFPMTVWAVVNPIGKVIELFTQEPGEDAIAWAWVQTQPDRHGNSIRTPDDTKAAAEAGYKIEKFNLVRKKKKA